MLDHLPDRVWSNDTATFFDPAIGGGQFVRAIEQRLRAHGHSDSNIRKRVFGFEESELHIRYAVNKHKLVGQYAKKPYDKFLEMDDTMKFDVVIGNPPFGLRGNLALRFINHSYKFADVVAFILPPLFNSTGKGVPMARVQGYKLAHTENLPLNSFEYPNGEKVDIATIFQVWIKINTNKIKIEKKKQCKTFIKVYSLSDGGTPSSTRNKKMLDKCDVYLPSTCFKGMMAYKSFEELPNKRGYGVVFLKENDKLNDLFFNKIEWQKVAFLSTNSAINLRTDLIENEVINNGFYDK
jgi:hypothetical protein